MQPDTEITEQQQTPPEYTAFLSQFDTIKEQVKEQVVTAIETARQNLEQLKADQYVTTLQANILVARQQVDAEAERLREEGLDPETLDSLVVQKNLVTTNLQAYQDLDAKIITTEKDYNRLNKLNSEGIEYLKIELKILNEEELINFLNKKL